MSAAAMSNPVRHPSCAPVGFRWLRPNDPIEIDDRLLVDRSLRKMPAQLIGKTIRMFAERGVEFSVLRAARHPRRMRPNRHRKSEAGPDGPGSRIEKWKTVNWSNTDAAIGRFMGVEKTAAKHQRVKARQPPFAKRGGNTRKYSEYQTHTP